MRLKIDAYLNRVNFVSVMQFSYKCSVKLPREGGLSRVTETTYTGPNNTNGHQRVRQQ